MFTNRPDKVERRVTDVCCLIVFVLGCIGFVGALVFAYVKGDPQRLLHLRSSSGQQCGVDVAVESMPYLYFCADQTGLFSVEDSVCVAGCPRTSDAPEGCQTGYESVATDSMVCMPANKDKELRLEMSSSATVDAVIKLALNFNDVQRAWFPLLFLTPAFSIAFGFLYIRALRWEAQNIFWVSFAVFTAALAGAGIYYIDRHFRTANANTAESAETTSDDLMYGIIGIVLAVALAIVTFVNRKSIQRSFKCLEAASECMQDMSSMMWLPIIESCKKALLVILFVFGAACLISCQGEIDLATYNALVIFVFFMFFWISETFSALTHFVVGFMAQEWYFSANIAFQDAKQTEPQALTRAYLIGLRYHVGSFAFGGLANVVLKPARFTFRLLTMPTRYYGVAEGVCRPLVAVYDKLAPFCDHAYLEISLDGQHFYTASKAAWVILAPKGFEDSTFQFHGSLLELQLIGAGCTSGIVAFLVNRILRYSPVFSDEASSHHIADTGLITWLAFIMAFFCVWPFMNSYGHVSDALLFCFKAESAHIPFGLGDVIASARERASLCEVPECLGGRENQMYDTSGVGGVTHKLKQAFDRHPPKTSSLFESLGMRGDSQGSPFASPLQSPR
eukprot:gb/GFBE01047685.1/.p1 GENE.gb/GFBE01047685.1/~~gb/GFBE01047685.1/.p1  ORF type:complete len:620 (+),score=105.68 gb/GFBE01047685.1/:1-1860(+)